MIPILLIAAALGLPTHVDGGDPRPAPAAIDAEPRRGAFLIARPGMPDRRFSRSVVLLLQYDEQGAMGLVVNRPEARALSSVLRPGVVPEEHDREIYYGGPVDRELMRCLVRSDRRLPRAVRAFGDVWITDDVPLLEDMIRAGTRDLRVYAGFASWAPGQLDREIEQGGWLLVPADPDALFYDRPGEIWQAVLPK